MRAATLQVLSSTGLVPGVAEDDVADGVNATLVIGGVWLGLAWALLLLAFVTPLLAVGTAFGARLNDMRGRLALIATNMILVLLVGYFVVVTSS